MISALKSRIPFEGKNVSVLGLGKTGLASALFLGRQGFQVFASDQSKNDTVDASARILRDHNIEAETGGHSTDRILNSDWVVISPGIPPTALIYQAIRAKNIPIVSEIEVASWYCPAENVIAVTGTSGKTTVTTLLARVFREKGFKTICCGNIGNPWVGEIQDIGKDDFVVLEVSSFQLGHCHTFRPHVGVLLNLSPNHQDWHPDMADYVRAKLRLFQSQVSTDFAVIREEDRRKYFPKISWRSRIVCFDQPTIPSKKTVQHEENPNLTAVRVVASIFGCGDVVDKVWASFEGIEHRLERVGVSRGVQYINDSKCTSCASLVWALKKFPDKKIILIAGGHPKSNDFDTVRDWIQRKVKHAILIGEARPLLRAAWQGACPYDETDDFKEAVLKAHQLARSGDVVLLSPACASFDMFKNYEERGNLFKKIARELLTPETIEEIKI